MGRPRVNHSMDAILGGAIAMLDRGGEAHLTLRGLAAHLGGGVGSLYWYVESKDELIDRATDHLTGQALAKVSGRPHGDDPIAHLRALGVALFDVLEAHPWMARYLMRDVDAQLNTLRYWDRVGQEIKRLGLPRADCFYGASAIVSFVVGAAAQMSYQGPTEDHPTRAEFLAHTVRAWSDLPADEFPYVHSMIDTFATHDDRDQFLFGLDLVIEGLRSRATRARGQQAQRT